MFEYGEFRAIVMFVILKQERFRESLYVDFFLHS